MSVRRREKPRIANTDPIGKPQASKCRVGGELFIDSMWVVQIGKAGRSVDECNCNTSFTDVVATFGK